MVQSPPAFHTFGELPTIKETKSHVKLKKKRSPIATKNLIELRIVPNKLLGVLLMVSVPAGLLTVPFLENVNKFQNPFRRPIAITVFLVGTTADMWLGIGATLPIDKSLTLVFFFN